MSIKQKILDHLEKGYTICYGQANTITDSQSGYRRLQEILADNPDDYEFVRVKGHNGGTYNVFAKKGKIIVKRLRIGLAGKYWFVSTEHGSLSHQGNIMGSFKEKEEAQKAIRQVVR